MYMCGIRKGSSSFFSTSTPSTVNWKDYSVLVEGSWHPYWKSSEHKGKGLFLHSPSCPIVLSLPLCLHYTLLMTVALKNCQTIFSKWLQHIMFSQNMTVPVSPHPCHIQRYVWERELILLATPFSQLMMTLCPIISVQFSLLCSPDIPTKSLQNYNTNTTIN